MPSNAVGIDVGPTNIKIVDLTDGEIKHTEVVSTWETDDRSAPNLARRIVQRLDLRINTNVDAVGVAWSTATRRTDGMLVPFRHWHDVSVDELSHAAQIIRALSQNHPKVHVELQKDGNMDAFAVHASEKLTNTVVLNLGTDITGGFVSPQGSVDFSMLAEFGAIIIFMGGSPHLSPWLPPGNLNDAASATAAKHLASQANLRLGQEPNALGPLAANSQTAREIRSRLANSLALGINEIYTTLRPSHVRLCGGLVAGDLGKLLVSECVPQIHTSNPNLDVAICSCDPMFSGALGAGLYARACKDA